MYLFATIAKKLQLSVEKIRSKYPDCIAYKKIGEREKKVHIEFEYKASNFKQHKHNPKQCDIIVCWQNDWFNSPKKIEIIELKKFFGSQTKVWIQPAIKSQWHNLEYKQMHWGLSKRASRGDLLLMYRCAPAQKITDIYFLDDELSISKAGWRDGYCYGGKIKKLCVLNAPIFLEDLRNHKVLKTSSFVRSNLQGNNLVSEYWPYLYSMIIDRNPKVKKILKKYSPENL